MDEEIIQQMGLLLTQVRVTRLSLESIERSTSRFTGLALQASGSAGPAFGAPPMIDGALKVYVMNVDDFVAPAGGGFFETVLGGLGRVVGGFVGGLVGGVIGGVQLGPMVRDLRHMVESIERVVGRLVGGLGLTPEQWQRLIAGPPQGATGAAETAGGPSMMGAVTGLLDRMPTGQVVQIVELLTRMVDALIIIAPLATGAVAALLQTVGDLRLAIVEWISFALRQFLLLRAVAVAVLADTASLIAPIAASLLSSISRLVAAVLSGLTALVSDAVRAGFATARVLAQGLTGAVNTAIDFLIGTVLPLLNYVQRTPLVRLFAWFTTALPAMLGALAAAAGSPLSGPQMTNLTALSTRGESFLSTPIPGAPTTTELDATRILSALDATQEQTVVDALDRLGGTARTATTTTIDQVRQTVVATAAELNRAAERANTTFGPVLERELGGARVQIDRLDAILRAPESDANRADTTSARIAASYRSWLTEGGMTMLLGEITRHFASAPADPDGRSIPGRVLSGFVDAEGRHDVIVEVGEVVIDVADRPGPAQGALPPGPGPATSSLTIEQRARARGGQAEDLIPVGVD